MTARPRYPESQRPPIANGSRPILDLVLPDVRDELVRADLIARAEIGRERYGVYLQANNGRDALWDAYEEALDLAMYLRQCEEEAVRGRVGIRADFRAAFRIATRLRQRIADRDRRARDAVMDAASDAGAFHEEIPEVLR